MCQLRVRFLSVSLSIDWHCVISDPKMSLIKYPEQKVLMRNMKEMQLGKLCCQKMHQIDRMDRMSTNFRELSYVHISFSIFSSSGKSSHFAWQILTVLTPKSSTVSIIKEKEEKKVVNLGPKLQVVGTKNFLWWRQSRFQTYTQNNPSETNKQFKSWT